MLKNIFFFALSATDLMDLYKIIKDKYNVIWIVYYKDVYEYLKKQNIPNVYFLDPSLKLFSYNNIFVKIIKHLLNLLKIKFKNKKFYKELKDLENKYHPEIIFTDTSQFLADYKTRSVKVNTKHSVCYKKYFLNEINFKFDYILLPGEYHKERIKKIYNLEDINKKFKVVGNIKVSQFLKKTNYNRNEFINSMGLDSNKINVLFAPSWDAHENDLFGRPRFLPKKYGDQYSVLKKLAEKINILDCNFIVKLHHLSHFHLKNNVFKNLDDNNKCFVFKSGAYHDISSSDDIFRVSDVIITNTSGVASTGVFLNKKLIFINPRNSYDWDFSDIEKNLRPGFICDSFDEIIEAVKNYIDKNDPFIDKRKNFVKKVFANANEDANLKIAELIPKIIS